MKDTANPFSIFAQMDNSKKKNEMKDKRVKEMDLDSR